jgi:hypothetical protein
MPRLLNKDWVGQKVRVLRPLQSKSKEIRYERGEVVVVAAYDEYMNFSIRDTKGGRFMFGLRSNDLRLLDDTRRTVQNMTIEYLERNPGKSSCTIAKAIDAKNGTVSSLLRKMERKGLVRSKNGGGPRGGDIWFFTLPSIRGRSRYEVIGADDPWL